VRPKECMIGSFLWVANKRAICDTKEHKSGVKAHGYKLGCWGQLSENLDDHSRNLKRPTPPRIAVKTQRFV